MFRTYKVIVREDDKVSYSAIYGTNCDDPKHSIVSIERHCLDENNRTKVQWTIQVFINKFVCYDLCMATSYNDTMLTINGVKNDGSHVKLLEIEGKTGNVVYDCNVVYET